MLARTPPPAVSQDKSSSSSQHEQAQSIPGLYVRNTHRDMHRDHEFRIDGTSITVHGLICRYEKLERLAQNERDHRQADTGPTQVNSSEHSEGNNKTLSCLEESSTVEGVTGKSTTNQERWGRFVMSLGCVIWDAVALSQVDCIVQQGQGHPGYKYYEAVERFSSRYKDLLNNKYPVYLDELNLDSMEKTHSHLFYFTCLYSRTHYRITFTGGRCSNNTEILRILRAFYRRSILLRLYYAGGVDRDHPDRQSYLKAFYETKLGQLLSKGWPREEVRAFNGRFLCLFEPWELEQIVTVDLFMFKLITTHLKWRRVVTGQGTATQHAQQLRDPLVDHFECDLIYLQQAQWILRNHLADVAIREPVHPKKPAGGIYDSYPSYAPHCFLFEQQVISYRNGYNKLAEHEGGVALPPFAGDAVDKIPFAWVDAFAGLSPHCRAFGLALPPVKFIFKHFLYENRHIVPSDCVSARAAKLSTEAKLAAEVVPPRWINDNMGGAGTQPFEGHGKYSLWMEWCEFGFVMWDRDRVETLKGRYKETKKFRTGWLDAGSLLDTMANVRLQKRNGSLLVSGGVEGSTKINDDENPEDA